MYKRQVSGALALLIDLFPNLTADQLVDLIFSTAQDLGAAGVDVTYGHGLIDLEEALNPQGETMIATQSANGTTQTTTSSSGAQTSSAFGDAVTSIPLLNNAVFLDRFDRAYRFDLGSKLVTNTSIPSLFGRLRQDRDQVTGHLRFCLLYTSDAADD